MSVQPTTQPSQHDPRIVALAKDPRTLSAWFGWWASGGDVKGFMGSLSADGEAVLELGLDIGTAAAGLLAYVRSVAGEVAETADEADLVIAILRDDEPEAGDLWPARQACEMTDGLVDAGLLMPDEEPEPLKITTLGRAVLLVLEQRRFAERRAP